MTMRNRLCNFFVAKSLPLNVYVSSVNKEAGKNWNPGIGTKDLELEN